MENNKIMQSRNAVYVGLFSALITIGAFIKIPVPVIPFTLQYLFVLIAGLTLGGRLGFLSVVIYIIAGLAGIPVFTSGGGPSYVFFPTFGYLIGFAVCAFTAGTIASKLKRNFKNYLTASLAGLIILHVIGIPYFYYITNHVSDTPMTFKNVFLFCFVYTVPGDILLSVIGAKTALKLQSIMGADRNDSAGNI